MCMYCMYCMCMYCMYVKKMLRLFSTFFVVNLVYRLVYHISGWWDIYDCDFNKIEILIIFLYNKYK